MFGKIGQWFASIGMSSAEVTTAVLSLAAIILSIVAIVQNARYRPRPHFSVEWPGVVFENEQGVLVTECRISNDGDAIARNVRVRVTGRGISSRVANWVRWNEVKPGAEPFILQVPLERANFDYVSLGVTALTRVEGAPLPARHGEIPRTRPDTLRPVVVISYRGRIRPVKERAPKLSGEIPTGGC